MNDISLVEVASVAALSESMDTLNFHRIQAPVDFISEYPAKMKHIDRCLAEVKTSSNYTLQFDLGLRLGVGHSSLVYEIANPKLWSECGESLSVTLPPLVVKFAARKRNKYVAREAWFYDEMQTIQGIAIPWCYGWFEATLPEGKRFHPWEEDPEERKIWNEKDPLDESLFPAYGLGCFNEAARPLLTKLGDESTVTLLILERLGGPYLPVSVPLSDEIQ